MKHLYRLVYWKRRLLGARAGNVRRPSAYRGGRAVRISERARPPLVFALIVGGVLAASALFGSLDGPHGSLGGETAPASDGGRGEHGYDEYAHEVQQGWAELSPECREDFGSIAAYAEFHEQAVEQPEDPDAPRTAVALSCGDGS